MGSIKRSMDAVRQRDKRWRESASDHSSFVRTRNRIRALVVSLPWGLREIQSADNVYARLRGMRVETGLAAAVRHDGDAYVLDDLDNVKTSHDLGHAACTWFQALNESGYNAGAFADDVRAVLQAAPSVGIKLVERGGMVTLYPAGARLLDDRVVDDVLEWLRPYPAAAKHFDAALQLHLAGNPEQDRNLLDALRFGLEQLLKTLLRNTKSLENQKPVLLPWLKERGLHQQAINMFDTLLAQFSQYQNQAVKHNEEHSSNEIEFMIYLTGTFMRLLLQLASDGS